MDRDRSGIAICIAAIFLFSCCTTNPIAGDIVTLTTATPTGGQNRASQNDFIGILDGVGPEQIGSQDVNLPGAAESFLVGDLVGRDINASGGGRLWEYTLALPIDAVPGTGFQNITFDGRAFETNGNNLDNGDVLTWELFLNGTSVDFFSTGGQDFVPFDLSLSGLLATAVTDIRVEFNVVGFDANNEWFATRGLLSADYNAIPEHAPAWVPALLGCLVGLRRNRISLLRKLTRRV